LFCIYLESRYILHRYILHSTPYGLRQIPIVGEKGSSKRLQKGSGPGGSQQIIFISRQAATAANVPFPGRKNRLIFSPVQRGYRGFCLKNGAQAKIVVRSPLLLYSTLYLLSKSSAAAQLFSPALFGSSSVCQNADEKP